MIFFDWEKIYKVSKGNSYEIVTIVRSITYPKSLYTSKDDGISYYNTDFKGFSFLINPYDLLNNSNLWSFKEMANYIGLASIRQYMEYKLNKIVTLRVDHSPLSERQITQNGLLRIQDGLIHFKYEDYTNGE